MKKSLLAIIVCGLFLICVSMPVKAQKVAIYSYPVEIELTNDQGDMPTSITLKVAGPVLTLKTCVFLKWPRMLRLRIQN